VDGTLGFRAPKEYSPRRRDAMRQLEAVSCRL